MTATSGGLPWRLHGESMVCVARLPRDARRRVRAGLPSGVRMLPLSPAVVVGAAYQDSPVGEYHEFAIGVAARIGLRPGLHVFLQVVDAPDARRAYRGEWGLPTDLGTFLWSRDGDRRSMRWQERGVVVRATPRWLRVPVALALRSVQRRSDGPVMLPRRMYALARPASVSIDVAAPMSEEEVDLSWLEGRHLGLVLSSMRMIAGRARHPVAALSSLRAPVVSPAPGGGPVSAHGEVS